MAGLPEKRNAFILTALGPGWANPCPVIAEMLEEGGYIPVGDNSMSIGRLMDVKEAGVLYLCTHGARVMYGENKKIFALATNSEVSRTQDLIFSDDLDEKSGPRLVPMEVAWDRNPDGKIEFRKVYAITEYFVSYYMTFGNNSFVYVDGCGSQNSQNMTFPLAFANKKNKAVYVGWVNPVDDQCSHKRAYFLFDRLLGLNRDFLPTEKPPQRPFAHLDVLLDMKYRRDTFYNNLYWNQCFIPKELTDSYGLTTAIAELKFTSPEGAELSEEYYDDYRILAPSISSMTIDESKDELLLVGFFGDDKRTNPTVLIKREQDDKKGDNCPIVSPEPHKGGYDWITCKIDRDGPNSAGYIQVEIDGRKSNSVPVTEWKGRFTYTLKSRGNLEAQAVIHVRFRGFIDRSRQSSGQKQPTEATTQVMFSRVVPDSVGSWKAKGSYDDGKSITSWSGSGELQPYIGGVCAPNWFLFSTGLHLDASLKQTYVLPVLLSFDCWPGIHWEIKDKEDGHTISSGEDGFHFDNSRNELHLTMDPSNFSIKKDQKTIEDPKAPPPGKSDATIEWTKMEAIKPPNDQTKC
jgi:hypothetical protein